MFLTNFPLQLTYIGDQHHQQLAIFISVINFNKSSFQFFAHSTRFRDIWEIFIKWPSKGAAEDRDKGDDDNGENG